MCRFLDAGKEVFPHAQLTGVQKAPRHEVAGGGATLCVGPTQTSRPVSNRSGYWGEAAVPLLSTK
jgi:hypothetical protein